MLKTIKECVVCSHIKRSLFDKAFWETTTAEMQLSTDPCWRLPCTRMAFGLFLSNKWPCLVKQHILQANISMQPPLQTALLWWDIPRGHTVYLSLWSQWGQLWRQSYEPCYCARTKAAHIGTHSVPRDTTSHSHPQEIPFWEHQPHYVHIYG